MMFVIFTDEAGDDETELDRTVAIAAGAKSPCICVGVPAPFGRREVSVKYVDPDPKYDQTPQWIDVRQGPESYLPELVKIGDADDEAMDSGFGPYSLTRLCYETGGIFFAVHPNRDAGAHGSAAAKPAVLSGPAELLFRSAGDAQLSAGVRLDQGIPTAAGENKARAALVQAAQMSWVTPMDEPTVGVSQGERRGAGQPVVAGAAGRGRAGTQDQPALRDARAGREGPAEVDHAALAGGLRPVDGARAGPEGAHRKLQRDAGQGQAGHGVRECQERYLAVGARADEISVGSVLEKQAAAGQEVLWSAW